MNPEPTGGGAGTIVSILFLLGLFAVMAYFVWKAYQGPRQDRSPYIHRDKRDSGKDDEEPPGE
jgi:hypothetical protein